MLENILSWRGGAVGVRMIGRRSAVGAAGLLLMAALWPDAVSACSLLSYGAPETILGRMLTITYDRILDRGCGGPFAPMIGSLVQKPSRGAVTLKSGAFLYVAKEAPANGSDSFVLIGMKDNRTYKVRVSVRFR